MVPVIFPSLSSSSIFCVFSLILHKDPWNPALPTDGVRPNLEKIKMLCFCVSGEYARVLTSVVSGD